MAENRGYIALCDQVVAQTQIFDYLTETALTLNLKSKLKYKWFRREAVGVSSGVRGYFSNQDFLEYNKVGKPMWTTGSIDGIDFATETTIKVKVGLTVNRTGITGLCSASRGYFCGNGSLVDGLDFGSETAVTLYEGLKSLSVNKPGSYGTSEVGYVISSAFNSTDSYNPHASVTDKVSFASETTSLLNMLVEAPYTGGHASCTQSSTKGYEKNSASVLEFANESKSTRTVSNAATNCGALSHTTAGYWLGGQENGKSVNKLDFVSGIESTLSTTFGINVFGQATASRNLLSLPAEFGTGYFQYSNDFYKFNFNTETVSTYSYLVNGILSRDAQSGGSFSSETKAYTLCLYNNATDIYNIHTYFVYSTETTASLSITLDQPCRNFAIVQSGTAGYFTQGEWTRKLNADGSYIIPNQSLSSSSINYRKLDYATETVSNIKAKTKIEYYSLGFDQRITRNDNNFNRSIISGGINHYKGWVTKAEKFDHLKESSSPIGVGFNEASYSMATSSGMSSAFKGYTSCYYSHYYGAQKTVTSISFDKFVKYTGSISISRTHSNSSLCSRYAGYSFGYLYDHTANNWISYRSVNRFIFATETAMQLGQTLESNVPYYTSFQKNTKPKLVHIGKGYFNAGYSDSYKFVLQAVKSIHFVNDVIRVLLMTLNSNRNNCAPASSSFMGYFAGGTGVPKFGAVLTYYQVIDGVEYSTETLFKAGMKLSTLRTKVAGNLNSSTKGYFVGGETSTNRVLSFEAILFAKNKAANPLITLTEAVSDRVGFGSLENGYIGWGSSESGIVSSIDKIAYATETLSNPITASGNADRTSTLFDSENSYLIKTEVSGNSVVSNGHKFTHSTEALSTLQASLKLGRDKCATVSSKIAGYITNGSIGYINNGVLEVQNNGVDDLIVEKYLFASGTATVSTYSFTDAKSQVGVCYSL